MKVRFYTATLTALCLAVFDLCLSIPLVAQPITTDISSLPVLARLACRERASREFNISLGSVAMLGLRLDRSANRTLVVGNSGDSSQTAFCTVNPGTARVTAFALTDLESDDADSSGSESEQEDVLKFQTSTYAVRVYREPSGRTLMNVYNRGTGQMSLSNAPAVSSAASGYREYYGCSTNREPCDGRKYTARIDDGGQRSLNIQLRPNTAGVTESETR
ncbi:MAG: hypothetical protein KME15_12605 [Drouetiella hepatica Uher 2000/2452]|jgi:hypothetical protein|uniref:Uncharacterized protein n=1 Tax=Drouetiella hepatica Uher 2000/2452 TaxID=904376 RepID=A0A951UN50_9CYAN|nr:hypothetical protein [Drouetiella hepatica Uher 2000/2452]